MLEQFNGLVVRLVQGRAPRDVAKWLCGATLFAMPKKDGGMRPIAVGEVLRRLAAKVVCAAYKDDVIDHLWPLQIGVGKPMGAEIGLQTARQWMVRNRNATNKVFVKLDFRNAFNTIHEPLSLNRYETTSLA